MNSVANFTSKDVNLSIDNYMEIKSVAHALSTELRLKIIHLIANRGMSVNEIARALDVPISTAALNIQVLEKAGVITCDAQPGAHGTMKICNRRVDHFHISLERQVEREKSARVYDMPVGCYSLAGDIEPTCGLARQEGPLRMDDNPAAFYDPVHFSAGLLWMREGFVEYNLPRIEPEQALAFLEISFEACAEAPCYRNNWPSEIYVCLNGVEIGVWHCPGDFGGRRGLLNPAWWNDANTQYGHLKTWRVDHRGTLLENRYVSSVCLGDLNLRASDRLTLRIGSKKTNGHSGGLNLFGRGFGDFPQNILVRYVSQV